jgi:hypothetical protein
MRAISFKNTVLFKRGVWLSAAALIVFALVPSLVDGSLWRNPLPPLIVAALLGGFSAYWILRMRILGLADEVLDCEDYLTVRKGRTEYTILMANISTAAVSTFSGIHRITIHLREPSRAVAKFEFLPQASLWSHRPSVERVASSLTDRALQTAARP